MRGSEGVERPTEGEGSSTSAGTGDIGYRIKLGWTGNVVLASYVDIIY